MNNSNTKLPVQGHHKKITAKERDLIAKWRGGAVPISEIARRLGRSKSSISVEIKRNSFIDSQTGEKHYAAIYAQVLTRSRKSEAGRRHPLKNKKVYAFVLDTLKSGWSPEQIAGRLERIHGRRMICHETIYRFIYAKENKERRLWEYLPRKRPKRRIKTGRKVYLKGIPNRVSIHERPEKANTRCQFGHWEGDSVLGRRGSGHIHTEVERVSQLLAAKKKQSLKAAETTAKQVAIFGALPTFARKSTTVDNGREFSSHEELKKQTSVQTYFADPYSPQQRGTNENHNGLLRRYLPRGSSFENLSQEELDDIVWEINNRPRKTLSYQTPAEVFSYHLRCSD